MNFKQTIYLLVSIILLLSIKAYSHELDCDQCDSVQSSSDSKSIGPISDSGSQSAHSSASGSQFIHSSASDSGPQTIRSASDSGSQSIHSASGSQSAQSSASVSGSQSVNKCGSQSGSSNSQCP
ncbi:hypothetical protein DICPUDRAFT_82541 [Dictyostelium purpureum]|uniref:Uncharacterized protein n=1 Tax=Dictyostelium purpureum TaxID=5786 RepID=F0ZWU4_DICPU|nr:uncharacterized protein DICPUDRAFT_82541 [Dictyostelium purpureum]EGC31575.1 hypothetical protein DICPUDRAFT_82541 [Dictyostelium purpureum]|eukprot:XP_003291886.1 hypothetical protein DICPUDRAFT_82541 [Dictyostelium purpureum]